MNCSSAEALFERFLDGGLGGPKHRAFASHLDRCDACRGVLEELRVVDALMSRPRQIDLAPNFTFATMAEARTLPPPAPYRPPVRAYLVSYLVAAWLLAGTALLFAPQTMHALAGTAVDLARSIADAFAGLGSGIGRQFSRGGNVLTAVLATLLAADAALIAGVGLALRFVRPQVMERMNS